MNPAMKQQNGIGPRFASYGSNHMRWLEKASRYLRRVGTHSSLARNATHMGWYIDNLEFETAEGEVFQLPARNGQPQFVAAIRDPFNDDCALVDFSELFDDVHDAARAADELARIYAEKAREADAEFQAEQRKADLRESIVDSRKEFHTLVHELRTAREAIKGRGLNITAVCGALRLRLKQLREAVREAREEIAKLEDNFWHAVER